MGEAKLTRRDWGWIFHVLTKGPSSNRCKVPLPDTILFKDSEPCRWVFTAKTGHVMSRSGNKLKLPKMKRRLMNNLDEEEDSIPACILRKGSQEEPTVSIISPAELSQYCEQEAGARTRNGTIAVQAYIDAAHPTSFRCVYTRIESADSDRRGFKFETYKVNAVSADTRRIFNRNTGGASGIDMVKSQMSEANTLVEGITFRICRFVESSLPLRVVRLAAEFVMDDLNQVWFTHAAEMVTAPKEKRWKPESGNEKRPDKVPNLEQKLSKPHRVRLQPAKDGTHLCAGDYCHDSVVRSEIDGGEDLSKFTNDANLGEGGGDSKARKKQGAGGRQPNMATHAVLYKSIYLARLERKSKDTAAAGGDGDEGDGVFARLQKTGAMAPEEEHAARCLPQLIPTYASKHSLQDYYDMVPVCHACSKVYQYLDRQRTTDEEGEYEAATMEPPRSPLLGNVVDMSTKELPPMEEEMDNSAAGIRERLMNMYCTAAAPAKEEPKAIVLNTTVLTSGKDTFSKMIGISTKKKLSNTDEDYEKMFALKSRKPRSNSVLAQSKLGRLPSVKKHEKGAFPRSKTSMDGSIAKASRGFLSQPVRNNTLPHI